MAYTSVPLELIGATVVTGVAMAAPLVNRSPNIADPKNARTRTVRTPNPCADNRRN
jgi:hypothetical protein